MKRKTLTILLMLMVAFTQAFGQTFEISPEDIAASDIYIIGLFRIEKGLLSTDKKDSLYHYKEMTSSRKQSYYDFGLSTYSLCKGNLHFFAYDTKQSKYYYYSDNIIGYIDPAYSSDNSQLMKKKVKEFHIPKVNSETANDAISEVYDMMEKEYIVKNDSILETRRLRREKFVRDSLEQVKKEELKRHEFRLSHDWHKNSIHAFLKCLSCDEYHHLEDCYLVTIDSNYCYYLSNEPTIKMLGLEYKEVHYSKISTYLKDPFFTIWKDTIANPKCNPQSTPQDADRYNNLTFLSFCMKLKEKAPYGFIKDYSWSLNSVNGIEPSFEFFNTNDKTIKYIEFHFSVFNAVNDICLLDYKTAVGKVRGVGPVELFDSGTWEWDRATHYTSAAADHLRIVKIVITYMDGTTKTLTGNSIIINKD